MFTGREFLTEVNLYDYRNRMYSADLGRFLQTDPLRFDAGDVNIYRYCGNNVLNLTDGMGLCGNKYFTPSPEPPAPTTPPPVPTPTPTQNTPTPTTPTPQPQTPPQPNPFQPTHGPVAPSTPSPGGGFTVQVYVTVNFQLGPINIQGSAGFAVDNQGNYTDYVAGGGGLGVGAAASATGGFAVSNAPSVSDLAGPFNVASYGGGLGLDAAVDGFTGASPDGQVTGFGISGGVGAGGGASDAITNTKLGSVGHL